MNDIRSKTRYQRVQQILNEAQGKCIPSYQGLGAFWCDIDTFKHADLYGQQMIAPADNEASEHKPKKSCCGGGNQQTNLTTLTTDEQQLSQTLLPGNKISPPDECWPTGGKNPANNTASQFYVGSSNSDKHNDKRSDKSGLIKGLRKQYPFDGSLFPPLLWDASNEVSAGDIAFIADWIDAGCPENDDQKQTSEQSSIISVSSHSQALAQGDALHKVSDRHCNEDKDDIKGLKVRKEVSTLSENELTRLREALACMYSYDSSIFDERSFAYWARIHTNSCQHGWEQFLPWHRLYLYFFEQTLQDYDASITLPYWSWSDYADANRTTYNTEQLDIGVLPQAYGCFLDRLGLLQLQDSQLFDESELTNLAALQKSGKIYNSGLRFLNAAEIDYTLKKNTNGSVVWSDKINAIYAELRRANPLWFPNRWPGSMGKGMATHYPTAENIKLILDTKNWSHFGGGPEYDHHFGVLEELHNGMHNFSGGQNPKFESAYKAVGIDSGDPQNVYNPNYGYMTDNRVTAFDPIFWAHHSNVDRMWALWQEQNSGVTPESVDATMPPWSMVVKDSLSTKKLGYEYMRDTYHYATNNQVSLKCFNSENAKVKSHVLDTHRRAEVRLHRLHVANLFNAVIYVFLNTPKANINTPIADNPCYVGQVTTFHGSCYGGPGHCDKPLPKTRKFDHRAMHHHEPRNFRIDASAAVQRMLANGENDISVHLVITGIDGKPIDDAVFIDGVSLNFMD